MSCCGASYIRLLHLHHNHTSLPPTFAQSTGSASRTIVGLVRSVVDSAMPTFFFFDRRRRPRPGTCHECLGKDSTSPSKYSLKRLKLQQSTDGSPTNICCSSSSLVVSHTTARRLVLVRLARGSQKFRLLVVGDMLLCPLAPQHRLVPVVGTRSRHSRPRTQVSESHSPPIMKVVVETSAPSWPPSKRQSYVRQSEFVDDALVRFAPITPIVVADPTVVFRLSGSSTHGNMQEQYYY